MGSSHVRPGGALHISKSSVSWNRYGIWSPDLNPRPLKQSSVSGLSPGLKKLKVTSISKSRQPD